MPREDSKQRANGLYERGFCDIQSWWEAHSGYQLTPSTFILHEGHLMYPQGCQDVILTRKFTSRVLFKKIIFIHLVVVNLVKFFSNCYGILQKTKFSQTNAYNNFIFIIHCIKMAHPGSTFIYVFKIHLI